MLHTPVSQQESDRQLVKEILGGSRRHFDLLYDSYFPRVHRYALRRLRDSSEAEDVAQEVFVAAFRSLPSFKGESSLLVWIFGIARNVVNRRFRRILPPMTSLDAEGVGEVHSEASSAESTVDARRTLDRCEAVISNELTPLQRRIFQLRHLRRQPIRSIARALGKSEDAVKANLYRMRRVLAEGVPGAEGVLGG